MKDGNKKVFLVLLFLLLAGFFVITNDETNDDPKEETTIEGPRGEIPDIQDVIAPLEDGEGERQPIIIPDCPRDDLECDGGINILINWLFNLNFDNLNLLRLVPRGGNISLGVPEFDGITWKLNSLGLGTFCLEYDKEIILTFIIAPFYVAERLAEENGDEFNGSGFVAGDRMTAEETRILYTQEVVDTLRLEGSYTREVDERDTSQANSFTLDPSLYDGENDDVGGGDLNDGDTDENGDTEDTDENGDTEDTDENGDTDDFDELEILADVLPYQENYVTTIGEDSYFHGKESVDGTMAFVYGADGILLDTKEILTDGDTYNYRVLDLEQLEVAKVETYTLSINNGVIELKGSVVLEVEYTRGDESAKIYYAITPIQEDTDPPLFEEVSYSGGFDFLREKGQENIHIKEKDRSTDETNNELHIDLLYYSYGEGYIITNPFLVEEDVTLALSNFGDAIEGEDYTVTEHEEGYEYNGPEYEISQLRQNLSLTLVFETSDEMVTVVLNIEKAENEREIIPFGDIFDARTSEFVYGEEGPYYDIELIDSSLDYREEASYLFELYNESSFIIDNSYFLSEYTDVTENISFNDATEGEDYTITETEQSVYKVTLLTETLSIVSTFDDDGTIYTKNFDITKAE